jgi:hypothetical protein
MFQVNGKHKVVCVRSNSPEQIQQIIAELRDQWGTKAKTWGSNRVVTVKFYISHPHSLALSLLASHYLITLAITLFTSPNYILPLEMYERKIDSKNT